MPSPSPAAPFSWLLAKEWRELMASRAWWVMLALTGPLVGLSFIGAVASFSEMSGGAGGPAGLAEALTPLDGIFIPTFGAFDLIATFLLPFVAIRAVSGDSQSGALKLLLQQPRVSTRTMVVAKATVLFAGCLIAGLAGALACALWTAYGGATSLPELVNLSLGHALHAALTIAIAVAAAAMTDHPATAAIVALGITVGTWAYEFISLGRGGWWEALASYMPTAMLRAFEHGLFRVSAILVVGALTAGGLAMAAIWLRIGVPVRRRVVQSAAAGAIVMAAILGAAAIPGDLDVSENRRNSFTEREEAALEAITAPLRINARLAPEDPRRFDLEHGAYAKLRRTMTDVDIVYTSSTATGLFEPQGTGYGEIWYAIGEKRVMERSTAEPIIVNTIVALAGGPELADGEEESFAGHPLVAQPVGAAWLFYVVWPAAVLSAGFFKKKETYMTARTHIAAVTVTAVIALVSLRAADIKVDLSKEKVGAEPTTFLPMVGAWIVTQDGPDKAIQVDGTQWKADLKSQPARSLAENARAIYGAEHEAFLDKVKAFAYYPVAYLKGIDNFTGGTITTKFKTVGGTLDTCSGILFNGKVNGDYLAIRHNGKDRDVRLWIFHDGVRTLVKRGTRMDIPVGEWHELKVTVAGADIKGYMDGNLVLEHTWTEPISGKVGLWSKTDSISNFKDYEVTTK